MSSDEKVFFVHADDWHSIAFIGAEHLKTVSRKLDAGGDMESDVAARGITLEAVRAALGDVLTEADKLFAGYTTDLEHIENGFGFYDDDFGGLYGTLQEGVVQGLYFHNTFCDCGIDFSRVMGAMEAFAARYDLVMVDWLLETVVDLRRPGAMQAYFDEM